MRTFFHNALSIIETKEAELGRLDAAAGDGDHGAGMVRGLRAAVQTVDAADAATPPSLLLVQAGSAFADAAGGASGPLFGMCMMAIGQKLGSAASLTGVGGGASMRDALQAGLDTVMKLGKAQPGDKTMIDALYPFVQAFGAAVDDGQPVADAWQQALPAAHAGMEATKEMVAQRGRSSKLGERSVGHADPGATSTYYLLCAAGYALGDLA